MPWLDRSEVTPIECDHHVGFQAFSERDDRGVGAAEWKLGVFFNELGDADPIFGLGRLHVLM